METPLDRPLLRDSAHASPQLLVGMVLLKEQGPGDGVPLQVGTVEKGVEEGQEGVAGQGVAMGAALPRYKAQAGCVGAGEV